MYCRVCVCVCTVHTKFILPLAFAGYILSMPFNVVPQMMPLLRFIVEFNYALGHIMGQEGPRISVTCEDCMNKGLILIKKNRSGFLPLRYFVRLL